ncbi:DNA repair helicase XPB [Paenibacillus brevis]|uniref:DNA 3'-5' helicase n=1 Tax=Paenibacillus brevis TaxID=2841508 RepID=A0ABS6FRJ5_9BACL|nr:DEAD/DEAH box helicase [Paenibacillus brevis]
MNQNGACIVQRDFTILLETNHPGYEYARDCLGRFAELVKSPSSFHTYRITPLSLWNAAAGGSCPEDVLEMLSSVSRWELPQGFELEIRERMSRYGLLRLSGLPEEHDRLLLSSSSTLPGLLLKLLGDKKKDFQLHFTEDGSDSLTFPAKWRGAMKQELIRMGYPVLDQAGYHTGQALPLQLASPSEAGGFMLRPYQQDAVEAFAGSEEQGGSGVIVLPCGAGKTIVGLAAMERLQCETLILTSNVTSVRQWIHEIEAKTTLPRESVGEYTGLHKQITPVTVSTYQILTHRDRASNEFKHMRLFGERDWGLIIYDEVHLLPAPVFRATAELQATRRLGLTATLVREDGCEQDVFSLIGPKRYDLPWKALEEQGFIAEVECSEVRIPLPDPLKESYQKSTSREKHRIAAENPRKLEVIRRLLLRHEGCGILIIGQYLEQLRLIAEELEVPLITGNTPQEERVQLFSQFREGGIPVLVVSKVANFAVDLPDASVAIQISGSFGSRQEEAQRLGRILRPKTDGRTAHFYTIVSEGTREQDFARKRQLFLIEQGYQYGIVLEQEGTGA